MAVGQYQLIIKGKGKKERFILLDTANGFVHVSKPGSGKPEWKPIITKSPPVKFGKG